MQIIFVKFHSLNLVKGRNYGLYKRTIEALRVDH